MPKGYVVFTEDIHDAAGMAAYAQASAKTLAGARVLVVDPQPHVLEGEWHGNRTVILEFDSVEAARTWYDSQAYRDVKPMRQAAARSNAVILTGFEMPA
jgi:uncharacterized protein (DUF1330 family)